MFQKGNKFGLGRPRIKLTKPELLLPSVFANASVNWAGDFTRLYKAMKIRPLDDKEKTQLKLLLELMPYLCTKVSLKDLDAKNSTTPADSLANAQQTSELLKALEGERNGPSSPQ